jgi:hypothetical protein
MASCGTREPVRDQNSQRGSSRRGEVVKTDISRIRRLHFGYYVVPEGSLDAGQPLPVCGYLVEHAAGRILFDTGFSPVDEATRQRYAPRASRLRKRSLRLALGLRTSI